VDCYDEPDWLLWVKPDSSWSWSLSPPQGDGTRLVTRLRARYDWSRPTSAVLAMVLMEFGDFATMRRMLLGIQQRAEASRSVR